MKTTLFRPNVHLGSPNYLKNIILILFQVNATYYKVAGAVGCITDGGVRDLQEMKNVGFHAMTRGVTISHAFGVSLGRFKISTKVSFQSIMLSPR